MLSLSTIEKYYPTNERSFKKNILREYLQYKILEIIFNSNFSGQLAFLGGTNLRIVHQNSRFSEDLDFDNFGLTQEQFITLSDEIKKGLELQGYEVEIKNVFKTAYRSYIRMPKVLFDNDMSNLQNEKILIQIDTVPHAFDYVKDVEILSKFDVFTEIYATPLDILLSQKIYAAVNRPRAKGRDFFDIVFLLPQTKPNYEYLDRKIQVHNSKELKDWLLTQVKDFDFDALAKDVEPFLIDPKQANRVTHFLSFIQTAL